MRKTSAGALFFLGLIMTFGAVGGIESSLTDRELVINLAAAAVGLVLTYIGVQAMRAEVDDTGV